MENGEPKSESEIDALARIVKDGFDRMDKGFEEMRAGFASADSRFTTVNKRIDTLSYRVDQLDQKLDQHRQETKDGFAAVHRMIGGMSHTLADHEERLKALEGE